jgi:ERCC4-type nuclease
MFALKLWLIVSRAGVMPVHIVVDTPKPLNAVPRSLRKLGVAVERRLLLAGGYEIGDRALVESKTVRVVRAVDSRDSALWLLRLAPSRAEVQSRNAPAYAQRPKRTAGAPAAEAALAAVPGISRVGAQAFLDRFGTLAAVARAEPSDWAQVQGIGPARAKALAETFHAPHTASRAQRSCDRQDLST